MPNYSNDYLGRKLLEIEAAFAEIGNIGTRWFGLAGTPAGETHHADRTGAGANTAECAPTVVDAGNDDWGTWTQILGSTDTPCDSGRATHYVINRLIVSATEAVAQRYMFQVAFQEDAPADDPGANDVYTEGEVVSHGTASLAPVLPVEISAPRVAAGTKAWMRVRAPNVDTSTFSFYFGMVEYF